MIKAELTKLFPAFSPKRAFEDAGEGWQVTGKHVKAQWLTNTWDVYIRTGPKRCNALVRTVPVGVFCKVAGDGEAWWQTEDVDLVRAWLEAHRKSLGIMKRRPGPKNAILASRTSTQRHLERPIQPIQPRAAVEAQDGPLAGPSRGSGAVQ